MIYSNALQSSSTIIHFTNPSKKSVGFTPIANSMVITEIDIEEIRHGSKALLGTVMSD